jgi:hypothetical protein
MNLYSNQDMRKDLLRYSVQAENRIRHGLNLSAHFDMDTTIPPEQEVILGSMTCQPNASVQNRKKSYTEIHGSTRSKNTKGKIRKRQAATLSSLGTGNDSDFITPVNQSGKSYSICKGLEHERPSCPKFKKWGAPELDYGKDKSGTARLQLSHNLRASNTYLLEIADPANTKNNPPRTNTPRRGVKGIAIQKKIMDNVSGLFFFE